MATILILQEAPGPLKALQNSLGLWHELLFAHNSNAAMSVLGENEVDLIIARVHLEKTNVFDFIRMVKSNPSSTHIPIICFCGRRTEISRLLDHSLAEAVHVFGAEKYITLDHFCTEDRCDFDDLRREIEEVLNEHSPKLH